MRNLKNLPDEQLDEMLPLRPIPRQQRSIAEKAITRHIREAGRKERVLTVRVARAMKYSPADD